MERGVNVDTYSTLNSVVCRAVDGAVFIHDTYVCKDYQSVVMRGDAY